jgi:hypothetical protein
MPTPISAASIVVPAYPEAWDLGPDGRPSNPNPSALAGRADVGEAIATVMRSSPSSVGAGNVASAMPGATAGSVDGSVSAIGRVPTLSSGVVVLVDARTIGSETLTLPPLPEDAPPPANI